MIIHYKILVIKTLIAEFSIKVTSFRKHEKVEIFKFFMFTKTKNCP